MLCQPLDYFAEFIVSRPGFLLSIDKINPALFKFFDKFWRHAIVWAIARIQDYPSKTAEEFQLARLKPILAHAGRFVPFWQDAFERIKFSPLEIVSVSELSKLPIMCRDAVKQNPDFYADLRLKSRLFFHTSGSTGMPLTFYSDLEAVRSRTQALYYNMKFAGFSAGSKVLRFMILPSRNRFFGHHVHEIGAKGFINPDERRKLFAYINKFKPEIFFIAPTPLKQLVEICEADNFSYKPRAIFTCTEHLMPDTRRLAEKFFECPIFDIYGNAEVGMMAQECREKNGFHINSERYIFEIVDGGGQPLPFGQEGEILVTFFDNKPMPFIRYDTGDRGHISGEPCSCGSKIPRIFFEGRSSYYLIFPDQTRIPLIDLVKLLNNEYSDIINKFQFIQESLDKIVLKIVPASRYRDEHDVILTRSIMNIIACHSKIHLNVQKVREIENLPNGKALLFISKLEQ
ncbi:MAG TPA: AMP-binding protein [Candidatus Paceibacterota bacterium]